MSLVQPSTNWITCFGPRLTANVCDTARCLHRPSPPVTTDRYSITFSYLSERPYLLSARDLARQQQFRERWGSLLNSRQIMALARTPTPTRHGSFEAR
jgi:hypothetical protein